MGIFLRENENFTFETSFLKTKIVVKKLKYFFLVERTAIEKTIFPYKTVLSKGNNKKNRMEGTKSTYHKEWSFVNNYFIL